MALQTSIACYLSTHKPQELQQSSNMIIDSENVIRKPHSSVLDSVPLLPTNNCSSNSNVNNNNNNNNNTVITSSASNAFSSTNPSVSLLSRNGGSLVRTFVMNGSLQSDSAACNKVSGLVNGPVSLLKDKQVCASSLTNPSQQNGEFRCGNSNSSSNNHHNNNCNVKEDTSVVSAQCQKTCAGFGGAIVHHSRNSSSTGNSNSSSSSNSSNNNSNNTTTTNSNNSSSGNKCAGGATNQIVTTKVIKSG